MVVGGVGLGSGHGGFRPSGPQPHLGYCSIDLSSRNCSRLPLIHLFARHLHLHLCIHQWIHSRTTQTPLCRISGLGVAPPRDPACQGDAAHRGVTWLCSLLTGLHGEGAGLAAGESGRHPRRVCGRRCHRGLGPLPSTPTPCCPPPDSTCSADVRGGGRGELRPIGF